MIVSLHDEGTDAFTSLWGLNQELSCIEQMFYFDLTQAEGQLSSVRTTNSSHCCFEGNFLGKVFTARL
ncbi:MAG: hypothetical protein F6K41_15980 [Symploca sp. SIO3E6]|nr:hypothetical protein [Caldora sp. SIO3E6]